MGLLNGFKAKLKNRKKKEEIQPVVCLNYKVFSEFDETITINNTEGVKFKSKPVNKPITERKSLSSSFLENKTKHNTIPTTSGSLLSIQNNTNLRVETSFAVELNNNSVTEFEAIVDREVTKDGKLKDYLSIEKTETRMHQNSGEFEQLSNKAKFNRDVQLKKGMNDDTKSTLIFMTENHDKKQILNKNKPEKNNEYEDETLKSSHTFTEELSNYEPYNKEENESDYKINFVEHPEVSESLESDEDNRTIDNNSTESFDEFLSKGYSHQAASIFFDDDDDYEPQVVRSRRMNFDNLSQASSISV